MTIQNSYSKALRFFLFLTVFVFSFSMAEAQTEIDVNSVFWSDSEFPQEKPTIQPAHYRTVSIDLPALHTLLNSSPLESNVSAKESTTIISLPLPDGSSESFSFVNSPVMAPGLAVKYPEIQVFLGQGVDNPSHTVRFDLTPQGFHAMILNSGSTVYIDPFTSGDLTKCISYTKASFYETTDKEHGGCLVENNDLSSLIEELAPTQAKPVKPANPNEILQMGMQLGSQKIMGVNNGSTLRTYRLALACTGEYASYHGGTTAGVISAMNTSMARVNGVFERDVCIRMIIVDNNESVIFLNSGSDPYSNGNGGTMLSQNQSTCDSNIGYNNYDIGHVFSTGGGGVAYLQSPCGGNKAGGVTGQTSPVNDPFDIDYVAHEMGHQWGGNHTQNNSCNRSSGAAYEPGSASTIMGYAGICAPNLQSNSDDHFHNHSINEMISFTVNGNGNSCDVPSSTNNTIPTVTIFNSGSAIPANTPFELIASGLDSDGDAITYNWEQYDLGPQTSSSDGNLMFPSGNQPIFRSWSSTTSNTRVFPRISDLVNGTTTIGEHLPSYSRGLQFKCSVRDNVAGGGAFVDQLMSLSVDGNSGPFVVTSPNSGSVPNGFATITWDVAGTNQSPVNCSTVEILLSTDGGYSFPTVLATGVSNSGSASVLIPNITTTSARFKIKGEGNVFFDISNSNVTITQGVGGADWDVAVQGVSGLSPDGCGTAVSPSISIVNLGILTITNFSLTYSLDGTGATTQGWTGSLASGTSVDIALCPSGDSCVDLGNGTHDIDVSVVLSSSDGIDEDLSNNQLASQFVTLGGAQVTLTLLTDSYPGETTWTVADVNGAIVWSGGAYATAQTEFVETTCLALGCYTLSVMDSYGDGMTYGGVTGHYELVDHVGTVLAQIVTGGDFGSQADHSFCLELVGIPGCLELDACNYNPNATVPSACIYPLEGFDCDGVSLCPLDLNSNGTVEVSDLLMILSDFGCTVDCVSDVDGDGAVTVADVLFILSSFGDPCPVL
ncbi:MAG: M12 family metallo-peptidase [Bacteroidetes bacterium]|nr:M12 family metallo-peptidase [Bacteroidota bacterium]